MSNQRIEALMIEPKCEPYTISSVLPMFYSGGKIMTLKYELSDGVCG